MKLRTEHFDFEGLTRLVGAHHSVKIGRLDAKKHPYTCVSLDGQTVHVWPMGFSYNASRYTSYVVEFEPQQPSKN